MAGAAAANTTAAAAASTNTTATAVHYVVVTVAISAVVSSYRGRHCDNTSFQPRAQRGRCGLRSHCPAGLLVVMKQAKKSKTISVKSHVRRGEKRKNVVFQ